MLHLNGFEIRIRKVTLIGSLFALTLLVAHAEDWTANGKTYRGVTVLSHTNITVTILYADGGATLNMIDLPPGIQQRYGMDRKAAVAAKAASDAQVAQDAAAAKAAKDAQDAADKQARQDKIERDAAIAQQTIDDQKQFDTFNAKAKSDYDSMDKLPITGQVYFLDRGLNDPIASTHVRLYSTEQAHAAIDIISGRSGSEQKKLEPTLADEKAKCSVANDALVAAKSATRAAAQKKWDEAVKAYRDTLGKYFSYESQAYYADALPPPVVDAVTDGDGKFTMQLPKTGSWVLVARGQHNASNGPENCLWIAKIKPEAIVKNQVALNNDNLSGDDSLLTCVSDSDIASLIQKRINDLTAK